MKTGALSGRWIQRITHQFSRLDPIREKIYSQVVNARHGGLFGIPTALAELPLFDRAAKFAKWQKSRPRIRSALPGAVIDTVRSSPPSSEFTIVEPLAVRPPLISDVPVWPTGEPGPPSFVLDYGETHEHLVVIRAAALRGEIHESTGEARQDAYAIGLAGGQVHIAVCDGVGTAALSDVGAAIATRVAIEQSTNGASMSAIGTSVTAALRAAAAERHVDPDLLSTTLCWMRVTLGGAGEGWPVEVAEWGDSEALRYDTRAQIDGHPDWNRLASERAVAATVNEPNSLPVTPDPDAWTLSWLWEPGQVLGAFSDGIAGSLDAGTTLGHALAKAWHTPPTPWEFAGQVAFRSAGAFDDRTAVVLWRRE